MLGAPGLDIIVVGEVVAQEGLSRRYEDWIGTYKGHIIIYGEQDTIDGLHGIIEVIC